MLKIDKELLKDILFEELYGLVLYYDNNAARSDEFAFAFSEDRKNITFKCVIENIWGNSCWEDSKEKREHTSLYHVDDYRIKDTINNLVIDIDNLKNYGFKEIDDLIEYSDNEPRYKYYLNENEECENYDCYYNHDVVRTTNIPVDEIAQLLLDFKFTKPLEEFKTSLEYIKFSRFEERLNNSTTETLEQSKTIEEAPKTKLKM